MDKIKQYTAFTALGCVGVMAAGWFLAVSPKRAEAADLRSQTASQVSANSQLQTQVQVLKAQAKDLPKQQAKLAAVASKIPDNPSLPSLVRALTAAGDAAGVELVSVTPGAPELVTTPAPASAVQAPAAAAAVPGAAPRPAAVAHSAAASSATGQLASIPITLNVVGGYFQVEQFVANLENLPRAMRMTTVALTPGVNPVKPQAGGVDTGSSLTTTITGQVFMAVNRAPTAAVSVPNQPVTAPVTVTPAKK